MRTVDRLMLVFLVADALVVGVLSVGFCYVRIGGTLAPIAAVAAGLLNCVLLWLAAGYTGSAARYAPLIAWVLVIAIAGVSGPGGDVELAVSGTATLPTLLLVVIGLGAPVALAWSGRLPRA